MSRTYRSKEVKRFFCRTPQTVCIIKTENKAFEELIEEGFNSTNRQATRANPKYTAIPSSWDDKPISAQMEDWKIKNFKNW